MQVRRLGKLNFLRKDRLTEGVAKWIEFTSTEGDITKYFNFESSNIQMTVPDRATRYATNAFVDLKGKTFKSKDTAVPYKEIKFPEDATAINSPSISSGEHAKINVIISEKEDGTKDLQLIDNNSDCVTTKGVEIKTLEAVKGCINYTVFQELLQAAMVLALLKGETLPRSVDNNGFKLGDIVFTTNGGNCKIFVEKTKTEIGFSIKDTTLSTLYKNYYEKACANAIAMRNFILSTYDPESNEKPTFNDWTVLYQSEKSKLKIDSTLNPADIFISSTVDVDAKNINEFIENGRRKKGQFDLNLQCLYPFSLKLEKTKGVEVTPKNFSDTVKSITYDDSGLDIILRFIPTGFQILFKDEYEVRYKCITFRNYNGNSEKPSVYFDSAYFNSDIKQDSVLLGKGYRTLTHLNIDKECNYDNGSAEKLGLFGAILEYINTKGSVSRLSKYCIRIENNEDIKWLTSDSELRYAITSFFRKIIKILNNRGITNSYIALQLLFNSTIKEQYRIPTKSGGYADAFNGLYPYYLVEKDLRKLRRRCLSESTYATPLDQQITEELITKLYLHDLSLNPGIHYKPIDDLMDDAIDTTKDLLYDNPFIHDVWRFGEKGIIYTTFCYVNKYFERNYEKAPNAIVIDGLFVDEDYRSQGIGKKLLSDVLRELKQEYAGLDLLTFVNSLDTKAIEFFTKNGFKVKYSADDVVLKYEPLKFTVNTKPKQKIHGCLDWNSFLGISLENKAVLRIRDRRTNEVISQLVACIEQQAEGLVGWILCFVTNPKYRGQGYGSKLLRKAERYLQQFGVYRICLHAQKEFESKLIPFYLNQNYRILGRDPQCRNEMTFYKDV